MTSNAECTGIEEHFNAFTDCTVTLMTMTGTPDSIAPWTAARSKNDEEPDKIISDP